MSCTPVLQRGSVFAIAEETTAGEIMSPSSGTDFLPLKTGFAMEYSVETIPNDELLNDEGKGKGISGIESVSGTHSAYVKGSGTQGTAPDASLLYESCMGGMSTEGTEYLTTTSSTTTLVKLASGGSAKEVGEALLIKGTGAGGYAIRNIDSISTNDITPNFSLAANEVPGSGVGTGKAVLYKPGSSHPTFSAWLYNGNGGALQLGAGNVVEGLDFTFEAGKAAEVEFKYSGSKYYFNPVPVITSYSNKFDITDDAFTNLAITIPDGVYDAISFATAMQDALNAASSEDYTVTYDNATGKFTITAVTSAVFSILWSTGTNTATAVNLGPYLGFSVAADLTGSTAYTSDGVLKITAPYTPSYDSTDLIVVKDVELFFGDSTDNICRCARSVKISVATPSTPIESICSETGVQSKEILSREVTWNIEMLLNQYDVQLFYKMKNNLGLKAMLNVGPKNASGWIPGKCWNFYLRNATVADHKISGDDFALLNVTLKGYVTSSQKDFYFNQL